MSTICVCVCVYHVLQILRVCHDTHMTVWRHHTLAVACTQTTPHCISGVCVCVCRYRNDATQRDGVFVQYWFVPVLRVSHTQREQSTISYSAIFIFLHSYVMNMGYIIIKNISYCFVRNDLTCAYDLIPRQLWTLKLSINYYGVVHLAPRVRFIITITVQSNWWLKQMISSLFVSHIASLYQLITLPESFTASHTLYPIRSPLRQPRVLQVVRQ